MKLPIIQWLLQGIPESLALAAFGLALAKEKLEIRKITIMGIILAVFLYIIRLLPLTFGVHSILSMFSLALLLTFFIKIRFSRSLLYALIVIITLAAAETVFFSLIFSITGISYEELAKNIFLYIAGGWPQIILIFILALLFDRRQRRQDRRRSPGEDAR